MDIFPHDQLKLKEFSGVVNPLMTGGNKKVTHTYTNLQLKAAAS